MNDEQLYTKLKNEGWIQTDASCNQYRKDISKLVFLFREDRIIQPITREIEKYESEIDLNDYTFEEMLDIIRSYGYTKEELIEWITTGENLSLIAECIFEMEN